MSPDFPPQNSPSEVENPPRAARESAAPPASPRVEHPQFGSRPQRRKGSKPRSSWCRWCRWRSSPKIEKSFDFNRVLVELMIGS